MPTPRLIALAAVAAAAAGSAVLPATAPAAAKAKKTCKTAKDLRTTRCLYGSKWRIVAADWKQTLSIKYSDGDKTFNGSGTAELEALDLGGTVTFPSPKDVAVPWSQSGIVSFKATSTGGWTFSDGIFDDCAYTAPSDAAPTGFGGVAHIKAGKLSVQWPLGGVGFACDYGVPETNFQLPIQVYAPSRFLGKKTVTLPIKIRNKQIDEGLDAYQTFDGEVQLKRVK